MISVCDLTVSKLFQEGLHAPKMLTLSLLVVAWLPACVALVGSATVGARPRVLLLDVLDTLVVDPFFKGMHSDVFGFESMDEFFAAKDNQAYLDFETGAMTEAECFDRYFLDGRAVDVPALRAYLRRKYKFVPKIEPLLAELQALPAVELHVLSNYGPWWTLIEEELALSRYVPWTFVSCQTGVRKPEPAAFQIALDRLGVAPGEVVFVDDSQTNVDAAAALGMRAVRATGDVPALRSALVEHWPELAASTPRGYSTCRVCRRSFVLNGPKACRSHSGSLRGESARKGDWESTSTEKELVLSWTCCGAAEDAPGCEVRCHATYDD